MRFKERKGYRACLWTDSVNVFQLNAIKMKSNSIEIGCGCADDHPGQKKKRSASPMRNRSSPANRSPLKLNGCLPSMTRSKPTAIREANGSSRIASRLAKVARQTPSAIDRWAARDSKHAHGHRRRPRRRRQTISGFNKVNRFLPIFKHGIHFQRWF